MKGLQLEQKKESQYIQWTIKRPDSPAKVFIPLKNTQNITADLSVPIGTTVKVGEKIAKPSNAQSVSIHSSLSGKITQVIDYSHPYLGESQAVEIESDEKDNLCPDIGVERSGWKELNPAKLSSLFQDYGLLDLRIPTVAIHQKVKKAREANLKTIVINACETEPYVSCDYSLIMSHPVEILKGADILKKAVGAEKIIIAFGEQEREAAELIKSKIFFLKWDHCHVEMVSNLYPQGHDRVLLRTLVKNKQMTEENDQLTGIFNVASTYSVYEAIVLQKPLFERAVTMSGECLVEQKNLWLRLGTPFSKAVKYCRGFLREPEKVVMGGPMTGIAQLNLDLPVISGTQAILALPKELAKPEEIQPCIRCGECLKVCPSELSPAMITMASEIDRFDVTRDYLAHECIECGNCAYVCPSKRPMVELIRYALKGGSLC